MPIYSRRTLRQLLGQEILRDIYVGATTGSWGLQAGSYNIVDSVQADPTSSGEQLYFRTWLRLLGSAGFIQDLIVGSFNTGSGAYLGAQTLATTIWSGMPYERHSLISPVEKDLALDTIIRDVRIKQELPLWSIPDGHIYSLGPEVLDIVGGRFFGAPTGSLARDVGSLDHYKLVQTASGQELRVSPSLPASYQLVLDAITAATLGAGDLATLNLPNINLVLWGAAARCLWMVEQNAPNQETERYKARRKEAALAYTKLAARFQPKITRKIQLEELW